MKSIEEEDLSKIPALVKPFLLLATVIAAIVYLPFSIIFFFDKSESQEEEE